MPLTHGSLADTYQAIAIEENVEGIDFRMFKGLEVGKEHKGRPVKKLESDDEGFKLDELSWRRESGQVLGVFQGWLSYISVAERLLTPQWQRNLSDVQSKSGWKLMSHIWVCAG